MKILIITGDLSSPFNRGSNLTEDEAKEMIKAKFNDDCMAKASSEKPYPMDRQFSKYLNKHEDLLDIDATGIKNRSDNSWAIGFDNDGFQSLYIHQKYICLLAEIELTS